MILRRLMVLLAVWGCWLSVSPKVSGASDLPPPEPVKIPTPATEAWQKMAHEAHRMRDARDTAGLEKMAAELRASGERLDGGTWLLSFFYDEAVSVPDDDKAAEEAAMAFYRKWAQDRPESITAQVCLAEALTSYAWNARGSGYADTVTDEGWRLMKERLKEAWDVLESAYRLPEKCPGWYAAAQSVALGQGWDRMDYLNMVNEGLSLQPTYGQYYTKACYWMLPRWHGEVGDFEKWIAERADTYPEAERDWQYARFVWMADRMGMSSELVFAPGRLDWERTKRGFDRWLQEKPGNLMVQTEYIFLSIRAGDRETTRAVLDQTGGRYYAGGWKDEAQFEKARRFAYEGGPDPFAKPAGASVRSKGPHIPEKVIGYVKLGIRLLSGLIGGLLAGTCLLVIALRRQQVWAGVIAMTACLILGTALGTITTLLPAAGLWLYLRRRPVLAEVDAPTWPGWVVLLVGLGLIAVYLGLQFGAAILSVIPAVMALPGMTGDAVSEMMMSDGSAYTIGISGAWIALLTLLAICPAQSRVGTRLWLGLNKTPLLPAVGWTLLAGVFLLVVGFGFQQIVDARTLEAVRMLALGFATPIPMFLAIVVAAPIVEELIFRGYLFSGWITKIGFWGTSVATSFLFAIMHIQYGPVGLADVFVMGMAACALRWKTGSVYPGIVLHMVGNFGSLVSLYYFGV